MTNTQLSIRVLREGLAPAARGRRPDAIAQNPRAQ